MLIIAAVVFYVEDVFEPTRRQNTHERFLCLNVGFGQRGLEEIKILGDFFVADVGYWPATDGPVGRSRQELQVLVEIGELDAFTRAQGHEGRFSGAQGSCR